MSVNFYAAMTLDGYIASNEENNLAYLNDIDKELLTFDKNDKIRNSYQNFSKDVDIYIIARKTYSDVINMDGDYLYKNTQNYVVTNNVNHYSDNNVTKFINYDKVIEIINNNKDKKIYIVGGANLAAQLLDDDQIDKIIITQLPILLGSGVRFFQNKSFKRLKLDRVINSHDYIEYEYSVVKDRS